MKKLMIGLFLVAAMIAGCATNDENKNTKKGIGIGAGAGALLGAVIGNQFGDSTKGAIIGGALGAGVGAHMGRRMDKQAKELAAVAETKRTEEGIVTKLKSDILFDTGQSTLKPEAKNNLREMATIMKKYPENVLTVNGYTDNTGGAKINEKLSEKRAEAVRQTLVANGLPAETVKAQGWGPSKPVAANDSAEGRKKNRRVEIEIAVDPSKVPAEK
ncbi:MAG: OmpA family protein [Bdellovibrio sp.]|jgi:outer membrane protein OmpA-like peptidoglycan-associated protein